MDIHHQEVKHALLTEDFKVLYVCFLLSEALFNLFDHNASQHHTGQQY